MENQILTARQSALALSGIPEKRFSSWRARKHEARPASAAAWELHSPFHALLLNLQAAFIDEHGCPPPMAADIAARAAAGLLEKWERLPKGLHVVMTAHPSGKERPKFTTAVDVVLSPVAVTLTEDIAAAFAVNATRILQAVFVRAMSSDIDIPPLADRDAWCRAMK